MKSPMASTKFLEPRIRALWNFDDPEASLHAMNAEAEVFEIALNEADAGLFEQALRCFELALAIREEEGEAKPIAYAREAVADARLALVRDTLDN